MALLIDTPRWEWRDHLWAHMISDVSLEELHRGGRDLNLRWVAFGRDHYDVPDVLWPLACEMAELVDSREIVRSLRQTGLRVHGGKPKKTWQRLDELPSEFVGTEVDQWLEQVRPRIADAEVEVLARPGELVVLHLTRSQMRPDIGELADRAPGRVVHTVADKRYSLELVLPWSGVTD